MLANDTLQEIEDRALEIIAAIEARDGKFEAEVVAGCSPLWHAVTTSPGDESSAVKFLADRGFGVYLPRFGRLQITRGRPRTLWSALFPRHLFLFVWDIKRHWRRIKACPGVTAILTQDERPVVVPDAAIDKMQAIEFTGVYEVAARRPRRKKRNRVEELPDDGMLSISCKSYWEQIPYLDDAGRIGALHKALGLAS